MLYSVKINHLYAAIAILCEDHYKNLFYIDKSGLPGQNITSNYQKQFKKCY